MDRKDFLKTSALLGLGITGIAAFVEGCSKNDPSSQTPQGPTVNFTVDLNQNPSLNSPGGAVSTQGVLIVNSLGTIIALAQNCTHKTCSIAYNKNDNNFVCPCDSGIFDTNGKVVSGPMPAPLKKYTVTQKNNILTIVG